MVIDEHFKERLKDSRKNKGITQSELANLVEISSRQIINYEKGAVIPRENILFKLAFHLSVSPSWLANGSEIDINEWFDYTPTATLNQVPIFELNSFNELQIDHEKRFIYDNIGLHPITIELQYVSKDAFAIRMIGDSMEMQGKLGMPDGSIVTFDPDIKVKSGDICLININDNYTIKQLYIDANQTTARALNPNYADLILKADEYKIIAKAVHIAITL